MPKTSEMKESKFLKRGDVARPVLATIESVVQMNVAKEGAEPEMKWCLHFSDVDKPMVLNFTNIQLCERICGSDDTDHWAGKKIVLYDDPNVSFGGKLTGGIRVRAPKQPSAQPKPAPAPVAVAEIDDDDIPF